MPRGPSEKESTLRLPGWLAHELKGYAKAAGRDWQDMATGILLAWALARPEPRDGE